MILCFFVTTIIIIKTNFFLSYICFYKINPFTRKKQKITSSFGVLGSKGVGAALA